MAFGTTPRFVDVLSFHRIIGGRVENLARTIILTLLNRSGCIVEMFWPEMKQWIPSDSNFNRTNSASFSGIVPSNTYSDGPIEP
jgi:hypothetical protein